MQNSSKNTKKSACLKQFFDISYKILIDFRFNIVAKSVGMQNKRHHVKNEKNGEVMRNFEPLAELYILISCGILTFSSENTAQRAKSSTNKNGERHWYNLLTRTTGASEGTRAQVQ